MSKIRPVICEKEDCKQCEEAKRLLEIKWGETTEVCPKCNKKTEIYYRIEGRFILNHCQSCHKLFGEDYPTPHLSYTGGLNS